MRLILCGLGTIVASAAVAVTPAAAQRWSDPNFGAAANVTMHHGSSANMLARSAGAMGDRRHRRHRDRNRDFAYPVAGWGYDFDYNQGWEPDSYNDWWHERPNRALPRWVQRNRDCERVYWSGGGWKC